MSANRNEKFRAYRKRLGLTQVQLAGEMGVSKYTIIRIEKGVEPSPGFVNKALAFFRSRNIFVTADDLFLLLGVATYVDTHAPSGATNAQ